MSPPLGDKAEPFDPFKDESTVKRSIRQERRIEKTTGGYRQPGSGSKPMKRGDVKAGRLVEMPNETSFLIEAKTTKAKSHSVSELRLKKITGEATSLGKRPAYWITFEQMPHPYEKDWVLIPASVLKWEK